MTNFSRLARIGLLVFLHSLALPSDDEKLMDLQNEDLGRVVAIFVWVEGLSRPLDTRKLLSTLTLSRAYLPWLLLRLLWLCPISPRMDFVTSFSLA